MYFDVLFRCPLISLLLASSWVTFNQHYCRWRCFSFYWFSKQEFDKFMNGIPVIGGPACPTPQSFHPFSCSWLVLFQWDYCDILHIPSLPLLSSLSVNLQLTCSHANPQIQFPSYHHGSPHMTLKDIAHKVKGNFLKKLLLFPAWHIATRFPLGVGPHKEQLFVPSDQSIRTVSCETNQVLFKLYFCTLIKYLYLQVTSLGLFIMTFCCLLSGTAIQFSLDTRSAWFFHMETYCQFQLKFL